MALLYPVLAQILLTFLILVGTGRARVRALQERRARMADIALDASRWPDDVRKFGNNYANQFETPVLFFVLVGIALFIRATDIVMVALAWLYVGTRIGHALVHTGSNQVLMRFRIFIAGVAVLMAMWAIIVFRLVMAG